MKAKCTSSKKIISLLIVDGLEKALIIVVLRKIFVHYPHSFFSHTCKVNKAFKKDYFSARDNKNLYHRYIYGVK